MKTRKYIITTALLLILAGALSGFSGTQRTSQTDRAKINQLEQKTLALKGEKTKMTERIYKQALEMDKIISEDNYILDIPLSSVPEDKLVKAVIQAESNGYSKAVSNMGAKGKMQIMPETLRDYNKKHKTNYTEEDLMNPITNEKIGRWYLVDRLPKIIDYKKIPLSLYTVLASYNRGAENVREWIIKQGGEFHAQPKETQNYVKKIYANLGFSLDI